MINDYCIGDGIKTLVKLEPEIELNVGLDCSEGEREMSCIVVLSPKKEKKEETIMNRFSKKNRDSFLVIFIYFVFSLSRTKCQWNQICFFLFIL